MAFNWVILFPILDVLQSLQTNDLDIIKHNNFTLAKKLLNLPLMDGQQLKTFLTNK